MGPTSLFVCGYPFIPASFVENCYFPVEWSCQKSIGCG